MKLANHKIFGLYMRINQALEEVNSISLSLDIDVFINPTMMQSNDDFVWNKCSSLMQTQRIPSIITKNTSIKYPISSMATGT